MGWMHIDLEPSPFIFPLPNIREGDRGWVKYEQLKVKNLQTIIIFSP